LIYLDIKQEPFILLLQQWCKAYREKGR